MLRGKTICNPYYLIHKILPQTLCFISISFKPLKQTELWWKYTTIKSLYNLQNSGSLFFGKINDYSDKIG